MNTFNEQELSYMKDVFSKLANTNGTNETIQNICSKLNSIEEDTIVAKESKESRMFKESLDLLFFLKEVGVIKNEIKNMTKVEFKNCITVVDECIKLADYKEMFYEIITSQALQDKNNFMKFLSEYDNLFLETANTINQLCE